MNIQNIDINLIDQHPENPRKDLGDLAELASSIKESGIHQNLTVVKNGDRYTCVIGHRRLAASKLAGLTEVPCCVAEMDYKSQLATMLVENMQRAELTYIEQADGFQMMFELGESVESISEMSGFSKETVKHRLEIARLDKENLKTSDLTLDDLVSLEKIEDVETRNRLLKTCCHSNLRYNIDSELSKIKREKAVKAYAELFESMGMKPVPEDRNVWQDFLTRQSFSATAVAIDDFKLAEGLDPAECFYKVPKYSWDSTIHIYTEREDLAERTAKQAEDERKRAELAERSQKLEELFNSMHDRFYLFAKKIPERKGSINVALRLFAELSAIDFPDISIDDLCEVAGIDVEDFPDDEAVAGGRLPTDLIYKIEKAPTSLMLMLCLSQIRLSCADYKCKYFNSELTRCAVRAFKTLGYVFNEEEEKLLNGTHELYMSDEDE